MTSTDTRPGNLWSRSATPDCGTGRVVLGAGARIEHGADQPDPLAVSLRKFTPSVDGGDAEVGAIEWWPSGYAGTWNVRGYAICAYPPRGYEVRPASGDGRVATAYCTEDRRVLGAGAIANTPITKAVPLGASEGVAVEAPGNDAAPEYYIMSFATCADTVPAPSDLPPPTTPCPPDLPRCEQQ